VRPKEKNGPVKEGVHTMTKTEIRQNLLGCLEIALFMRVGADRFQHSGSMIRKSFLIPVILLPLSLAFVLTAHPQGALDTLSMQVLAAVYALRLFVYLAAFLGVVYLMARTLDRLDAFSRFAIANNWLTIPAAALMLPLSVLQITGQYTFAEVYPLMVFITLYSYAYTAFMATHILRIPAELACCLAIIGMAINQTSLQLLKTTAANAFMLLS
jgi:hypothetical protein